MKSSIVKSLICVSAICFAFTFSACTQNSRARNFGGSAETHLPAGKKLVTATWKDANLWLLTRNMRSDEVPETYEFVEDSSIGIFNGTVKIIEKQ